MCVTTWAFSHKTATCVYTGYTIPTAHVLVRVRFDRVTHGLLWTTCREAHCEEVCCLFKW